MDTGVNLPPLCISFAIFSFMCFLVVVLMAIVIVVEVVIAVFLVIPIDVKISPSDLIRAELF